MNCSNELGQVQKVLKNILSEFIKVCEKYNLNYWVEGGTLLGTIRHKGFIPWDDDIDVCMVREDYNKFLEIANKEFNGNIFVQSYKTEEEVKYNWVKLRSKKFILVENEDAEYHQGAFIDIFPIDYYSENYFKREFIQMKNQKLFKLSCFKEECKKKGFKKDIIRKILKGLDRGNILSTDKRIVKGRKIKKLKNTSNILGYGQEVLFWDNKFKYDEVFPLKKRVFEDIVVNVPNLYRDYLINLYGENYMELPPEEERVVHNIKIISIDLYQDDII
ncbi:LicD family protein [Clostridium fallax]|uniref:Lipopolysaccharide cholinephosphotransferase n=1 Tax=Clostridium fallax TaxID=1533 RepID=A0A1M4SY03_9CLOT|nr:LicD family protein [Clostridium fallax]SHE37108.1 lipopolysaccharide cholinephosphotransferase [Clostridium fallax]SQB08027.1 LicD family protein [Clostridium fallax]